MNQVQHDLATEIHQSIDVAVPLERAYQVFTQRFDEIKPREHNLLAVAIAETVFEAWPGGHLYDRGVDGSICRWGRVLAVEAPHRITFSWDISPTWQLETDHSRCSEVEVTFETVGDDRTRVTITHRHLDRHGDGWEGERDAVAGPQGWPLYTDRFAAITG